MRPQMHDSSFLFLAKLNCGLRPLEKGEEPSREGPSPDFRPGLTRRSFKRIALARQAQSPLARNADSTRRNAVRFSSSRTMKTFSVAMHVNKSGLFRVLKMEKCSA